jgi:hypothetical protein
VQFEQTCAARLKGMIAATSGRILSARLVAPSDMAAWDSELTAFQVTGQRQLALVRRRGRCSLYDETASYLRDAPVVWATRRIH